MAQVSFGDSSGIMSSAGSELPYPCLSRAMSWVETSLALTSLRGNNVMVHSHIDNK